MNGKRLTVGCIWMLAISTLLGSDTAKPAVRTTFIRPVGARYETDTRIDEYFLYPFGHAYREENSRGWMCMFNLFHYRVYHDGASIRSNGTFMPFYFYQSGYGDDDYRAIWPIGGKTRGFLGKERAEWFMWPLYVKTVKQGTTHVWRPWPIWDKSTGVVQGMAIYPIGGHFRSADQESRFFLWPLGYKHQSFKHQTLRKGFLPFYAYEETPNVKDVSIGWPFFGRRVEKQPAYQERRLFWPLVVIGKGTQRCVKRYAPFYTHSENKRNNYSKTWYLWPFIKEQRWREGRVDVHQEQVLYFLFWHQEQFEQDTHRFLGSKTHFWPLYSYWDNGKGHKQMQMISPIEPIFQSNEKLRDLYMPIFNLYRYDETPEVVQQSFLFNCFKERRIVKTGEVEMNCGFLVSYANTQKKKYFSLFNGLIEYKKVGDVKTFRLFWIPLTSNPKDKKSK